MKQDKKKVSNVQRTSSTTSAKHDKCTKDTTKSDISRYGIGFDVHKRKIAACVAAQLKTGDIVTLKQHIFSATPRGINEICSFIQKYTPISCYLMECTGVYHLPLYHSLKASVPVDSSKVIAMNPLLVNRRITELGNKTDKADAQSMAYLTFYSSLLRPSYVGSMEFFRLRDTMRRYYNSMKQSTRFKNRITRLLHIANIKDVFDLSREWALVLLDRFISKDWVLMEAYEALIDEYKQANMGTSVLVRQISEIYPYGDCKLSEDERFALKIELSQLLREQIVATTFLRKAETQAMQVPALLDAYEKLLVIPGMGAVGALTILLELGDYSRFADSSAFAKFCGTAPMIYNSGDHVSRGRLNRFSNKFIRTALVSAAGVIVNKCRRDTDIAEYAYQQKQIRHLPHKKALMKVANKLAKTIYYVLIDGIQFDENYESKKKRAAEIKKRIENQRSLLPNDKTRALRRDINKFICTNYEFLNSSSRFLLCTGMQKMLKQARDIDKQPKIKKNTGKGKNKP